MHQLLVVPEGSTAEHFVWEAIPPFKHGPQRIDSRNDDYVRVRLNDLAHAISRLNQAPQEPEVAEISGVDFENDVFTLNRTFRDRPFFVHKKTDVQVWKHRTFFDVNRMVLRGWWRQIFAECEYSIGAIHTLPH